MKKLIIIPLLLLTIMPLVFLTGCEQNKGCQTISEIDLVVREEIALFFGKDSKSINMRYLGTFNGASVVFIIGETAGDEAWSETIGGVTFHYGNGVRIQAWKDGYLHNLQEAYERNFLTRSNLRTVVRIWESIDILIN